jgi:hypothetical protein
MTRVRLGLDLYVVRETPDGMQVEGRTRLRPGRQVEIAGPPSAGGAAVRPAQVDSWTIVRIDAAGVVFRGWCAWVGPSGPP